MKRLLSWFADPALAESVAGDLEEQRRRKAAHSPRRAALWFVWKWFAIVTFAGGVYMAARASRLLHSGPLLSGAGADLRSSVRSLRRSPSFTATVIGLVALSMALATTVFTVVDGVLFRPLALANPDRLVSIEPGFTGVARGRFGRGVSAVDLESWRVAAPDVEFAGISAQPWSGLGEGVNETHIGVAQVTSNFFDTIGVHPMIGGFTPDDFAQAGIVRPFVMTYELWQSRFHGAPDVVGQQFVMDPTNGFGFRIVGIMPPGFVVPTSRATVNFITALVISPASAANPTARTVNEVIARVPVGMSFDGLQQRIEIGMAAKARAFPAKPKPAGWSDAGWRTQGPFDRAGVQPLATALGRNERPLFRAVFLAALILLAIAAINLSALMAARSLDRAREVALRRAIGASAAIVARLIMLETAVPVVVGSIAGLALAMPLLHVVGRLLPDDIVLLIPRATLAIDPRVIAFVGLGALAVALSTTIWPIRQALRSSTGALAEGGRASTRTRSLGRALAVVGQVAGALVLTVGGALLVSSMLAVYSHRPAVRLDGIAVLGESIDGPGAKMGRSPERTPRMTALIDTLRRVPGVEAVALTDAQVLVGGGETSWFTPPAAARGSRLRLGVHAVTSDFYRVVEPELVMGRFPNDQELAGDAPVIVVSETVARTYWPGVSPLGQTLVQSDDPMPFTVVGVVKDIRWNSWDEDVASIYGPYARLSRFPFPTVFIHTTGSIGRVTAAAMQAIAAADPLMRTERTGTFAEVFADSVRPRRFQSWLFGSFAVAALAIVGVGLLGLISMATAGRTREMGIRLALGSTRERLVRLLLQEQLLAVLAGVVLGSAGAAWSARFLRTYLYEITPYDPRVWAVAVAVIVATAVLGTLVPALRASRTDPVGALRAE